MADCKWNKVRFKSFSQSEWHCATCGETGYGPHEKPPANCLRRVFGIKARYNENARKGRLDKITAIKLGGNGLPIFIVIPFIALLVAFSYFKCNIDSLIGFGSSVCSSVDLVDEMYNNEAARGLRETDATTELCDGFDNVDYADVEEYIGMLRREIELLDNAINGSSREYQEEYSSYLLMWDIHRGFYDDKIDKCFDGDDGNRLALEVTRMHNFISEKADTLYNLSKN